MNFIFFTVGLLIGIILTAVFKSSDKIYGVIEVDHETEMVKFLITSKELADYKNKKATFVINHEGKISRDKQIL